jgi:hypothetical protein
MPAIGVRFKDESQYNPDDVLIYCNLYHQKQIERKMSENDLAATRKTCRKHCGEGGCIPLNVSQLFFECLSHRKKCDNILLFAVISILRTL